MAGKFLGQQFYDRIVANMKDDLFTKISMDYIHEVCFSAYARPDLEFRERSLLNLGMLIALGRGPELRIHIRAAANNGFTEEQIAEACRHAMIYCGVPAGRDALIIASEVFEQLRQAGEYPKK
ncbi:hypothetical protein A1O7_05186 [Cladophialophora yegresii CBS 114405]|uniref:Carboxymuconolactone decarboxylase-like domain-containing protein n=1 Tax=Cladophialophora yegresii CBS 114405 TaxID=1182544 RepID=W9VZD7_9EURO|nr:uncharacterized protein A1O7_05186 [Cladophialophora yegresii CBS 114405]EXJ61033.1 hypothetical protein A1O7_05186 [Cladophialophora yegresii CBS 114405]